MSIMDTINEQSRAKMEEIVRETDKRNTEQEMEQKATTLPPHLTSTALRNDSTEVVFKAIRSNLGFFYAVGKRAQFENGYLVTKDPDVIKYVKEQLRSIATVVEEGPLMIKTPFKVR